MSNITITDFKQRLAGKVHGTSVNKIQDFYGVVHEAAGNVLGAIDPKETIRISQIANALYDQVYEYVAPADLKDDAVLDVRPQASRTVSDNFTNVYQESFDINKSNQDFTVQYNSGIKTLRISKALTAGIVAHTMNSITDNGTWATGGNATSLAVDSLNKVSGSGSLKFDISAAGSTAYLENSTLSAVDWSTLVNTGAIFAWAYIPNTTDITSINLRWGSSSADYFHRTVTTTQNNTAFITGWNLLRFDWSGATAVGTSVNTAIDYLRVTFNYNGTAVPSCRVDNIIGALGTIYDIAYYSNYLFKTSAGVWIEKPTDDSDIINLDVTGLGLLLYEVAEIVEQEIAGRDSSFDISYITNKKKQVWDEYKATNKSERMKKRSVYYSLHGKTRR